jgi:hypothetical protein
MNPLSQIDIESELSYAYLHAVACKAGFACEVKGRHHDNRGVDAEITGWGLNTCTPRTEASIKVQLKATIAQQAETESHLSYFLAEVKRYDDLRAEDLQTPRILVVLFLPKEAADWLAVTSEKLLMKKSAYWVSLVGAAASSNKSGQTIYLPKTQLFTPESLTDLLTRVARKETLTYVRP